MIKWHFKNIWNKESNTPFAVMNNIFSDTWNLDKGFKIDRRPTQAYFRREYIFILSDWYVMYLP